MNQGKASSQEILLNCPDFPNEVFPRPQFEWNSQFLSYLATWSPGGTVQLLLGNFFLSSPFQTSGFLFPSATLWLKDFETRYEFQDTSNMAIFPYFSREPSYMPPWKKGKTSTQKYFGGGDMLVPKRKIIKLIKLPLFRSFRITT